MRRKNFYCYICKRPLEFKDMTFMYNYFIDRMVPVCKDDRLCYRKRKEEKNGEVCQESKNKQDCHYRQGAHEGRQGKRAKAAKD